MCFSIGSYCHSVSLMWFKFFRSFCNRCKWFCRCKRDSLDSMYNWKCKWGFGVAVAAADVFWISPLVDDNFDWNIRGNSRNSNKYIAPWFLQNYVIAGCAVFIHFGHVHVFPGEILKCKGRVSGSEERKQLFCLLVNKEQWSSAPIEQNVIDIVAVIWNHVFLWNLTFTSSFLHLIGIHT